jgi:hypothetical protein
VEHRSERRLLPRDVAAVGKRSRGVFARPVGSYVPKLTRKVLEKYGFSAATLITDWSAIVGADIAAYAQPERLKWPRGGSPDAEPQRSAGSSGATLQLRVEGARALDVQYRSRQIIERINAYFGYRAVAQLRLLQAPIAPDAPRQPAAESPRALPIRPSREVAGIADERLRLALARMQAAVTTTAARR